MHDKLWEVVPVRLLRVKIVVTESRLALALNHQNVVGVVLSALLTD